MKNQLMLALSLATVAAISAAPLSAQATQGKNRNNGVYNQSGANSGCTWYDVNCRLGNGTNGTADGSWQVIGRDQSGNTVYQRQRTDRNGNVIVERARRDSYGRMVILDSRVLQSARRSGNAVNGQNNQNCKYNKNGYKCKYNKNNGNRRGDDDGDENDRYENRGTHNDNNSGPWYDQRVDDGNGRNGKNHGQGHGKHH